MQRLKGQRVWTCLEEARSAASAVALLPYTDEGPRRMSPMSVLFLKSSALMLLVFDHWNKENEMISAFPIPKAFSEVSY